MNSLERFNLENASQYTPVTCLSRITGTDLVLSGSATRIELSSLNSDQYPLKPQRWKLFERERIHRIVFDPREVTSRRRRAVILGGKEAILVELALNESHDPEKAQLTTLCRFAIDDFAGDASFLEKDRIMISTLHNSILVYSLPPSSPSSPSSSTSSSSIPLLYPITAIHAPARPLLWTSRFSQPVYELKVNEEKVRLAGGSLLGTVLVWDIDLSTVLGEVERGEERTSLGRILGTLRSLSGHRGAIFTVAFSPTSSDLLASGSDDRTLRIWDLSPLSTSSDSANSNVYSHEKLIQEQARVWWGHEGRVWRIEWVDENRLVSVAEDATCRLWKLNSTDSSNLPSNPTNRKNTPDYSLVQTWRDGHDGRTIWSVNVAKLDAGKENERLVVLTGGADGAIRSWTLPSTTQAISTEIAPLSLKKLDQGSQIKSFVVSVNPLDDQPVAVSLTNNGSFYLSNPTASLQQVKPFHSSPSFANTATSLHLHFDDQIEDQSIEASLHAFTNRGTYLFARLSFSPSDSPEPTFRVIDLSEHNIDIRAVSVTFNEARTKLAIWERASWKVHVCSVPSVSSPPVPQSTIDIPASSNGSTAPTCSLFVNESLLLLGSANGQLSIYSLESTLNLLTAIQVHSDGVSDLRVLSRRTRHESEQGWEIESVGRDGKRKLTEISRRGDDTREMVVVDERWIAKGTIEKILVDENENVRYLALVDTRAAVFDSLGRLLYSFDSPAKQSLSQYLETRSHGSHYYSIVQGRLTHQSNPSTSASSSIVSPGLHGREIRAVKSQQLSIRGEEVTIVASAAENGVLAISQLLRDNSLRPLYINRYLPSSLKSLAFSTPTLSQNTSTTTLYACGTRELLTAFQVEVVSTHEETTTAEEEKLVEVRVLERGMILADIEGGEVRTMDIALIETKQEGERLVISGYSDGKLKLWRHANSVFELVAETEALAKCVLSVEVAKVVVNERERLLVISGQSDGRLSIRDFTSLITTDRSMSTLPAPFFVSSPHQSGINGLSASSQDSHLIVATAGDDNAVALQRIKLGETEGKLVTSSCSSSIIADAHASTIQGLDFLSPTLLASSSVEQRLNIYSVDSTTSPPTIVLTNSTCLDVADCSAQDVTRIERGEGARGANWRVLIAGIGIEVVELYDTSR